MGNLYRLNALFELEIGNFQRAINFEKTLLERNTALEYLFLLLSRQNDYIIISENPNKDLLNYWEKNNIVFGKTVITDNPYYTNEFNINKTLPKNTRLIEWGKTSIFKQSKSQLIKKPNIIHHSIFLNSKINQTRWKDSQKVNNLISVICQSKHELEYTITILRLPLVIKTEFGFSGRGHRILKNKLEVKEFLQKNEELFSLNKQGVIVEEWVEENKIQDFSGIFDISLKKFNLLAITKMLVDKNGIYRGSMIQENYGNEFKYNMNLIVNNYSRYSSPYKGPISIDGFTYQKENEIEVQYMSEINFRYSMGRVLYELYKKIDGEKKEYALIFFPVKNKALTFKSLISDLTKMKKEYKSEILLATPLSNSMNKHNQLLGVYLSNKKKIPLEIISAIKKLLL